MSNTKYPLSEKISKASFNLAVQNALKKETLSRYSYIANKRERIFGVMQDFIDTNLDKLDNTFQKKIRAHSKKKESGTVYFRDGKTYEDVFKDNEATLLIQNLLGIFIFANDWEMLQKEHFLKLEEENNHKKNPKTNSANLIFISIISSIALITFLYVFFYTQKTISTEIILEKNKPILETKTNPLHIIGSVISTKNKAVSNANLFFEQYNYKLSTNEKGIYLIEDSLLINHLLSKQEIEVWIAHNEYETKKILLNKNVFIYNDSLSNIILNKAIKQTVGNGTQINIEEINNEKGTIQIGPTVTIKE